MSTYLSTVATAAAIAFFTSAPHVTTVTPERLTPGPAAQVLVFAGDDFRPGMSLTIATPGGGTQAFGTSDIQSLLPTSFQISIALFDAGTYSLVAVNPDTNRSAPFTFTVGTAIASVPAVLEIASVTPSTSAKQTDARMLHVEGRGFVAGLVVSLTDPAGVVTQVSGTDVQQVTAGSFQVYAVLAIEGRYTLSVANPDRTISNAVSVTVTARTTRRD